jgi:23S rRNA (cytidine1920-2'-O)/16S rRNA (cytidine1409-2'-O)-methyltransferase
MPSRVHRLDAELTRRGLARSREHAVALIAAGRVEVRGVVARKPASGVDAQTPVRVVPDDSDPDYASRGGFKLAGALAAFPDVPVADRRCLDAGASTGGFTDVLLRNGAGEVVAVDVGYGQLDWRLRSDDRVRVLDRTNVRNLSADVVLEIAEAARALGWQAAGVCVSPLAGPSGNVEFFLWLRRTPAAALTDGEIRRVVEAA